MVKSKMSLKSYSEAEDYRKETDINRKFNDIPNVLQVRLTVEYKKTRGVFDTRAPLKAAIYTELQNQGTLEVVDYRSKVPPEQQPRVMLQLAKALRGIHKKGYVHRDIKGPNILLCRQGQEGPINAFMADFGLSSPKGNLENYLDGTQKYFSPEQMRVLRDYTNESQNIGDLAKSHNVGPKVDVWQLGLVFYEMVYGNLPYTLPYSITLPTPYPSDPNYDKKLLINKMLNPDPQKRLSSEQVYVELQRLFPDVKI
jgi:serine/threonine protein kinase